MFFEGTKEPFADEPLSDAEPAETETSQETESPEAAESTEVQVDVAESEGTDTEAAEEPAQEADASKTNDAGAAETSDDAEGSKLDMKWFVIHTYSGHENKVKENILKMIKTSSIEDQFGRLIVPTEEVAEMKKGKKTITTRKFFPSYILIEMFMSDESWHLVNGIPGVTSFVGSATKPQPLMQSEVERILGRMDKEKETIVPEIPYTLGEHIRIKDGPFSDFTGVVDQINAEKGKLRVLVSIFGRETPVELDFLQVEALS
jgi:transcriptional antiterminator NusG